MIEPIPARPQSPILLREVPAFRFAGKGVIAVSIKIAGAGMALALQVTLARVLGHSGYGQYAYAYSWLQLMLIFAQGGFSTAAMRYVAEYRARQRPELVQGFIRGSARAVLIESIVLAMVMAGVATALCGRDFSGTLKCFLFASITLPFLAQFMLATAVVRGLGHVLSSLAVGLFPPVLLLGALLTTDHLLRMPISSSDAMLLTLCAALGGLSIVCGLQQRLERREDVGTRRTFLIQEWLRTATQMMIASSLVYLLGRTGTIISGLFLDARAVGTYAAAERFADVTLIGLTSMNMLAAPKFSALYAQNRVAELRQYARMAAWGASGFMFATVLPLVVFSQPILRCFGEDFVAGYPVLMVLLCAAAVNTMCGPVGCLLNMTGHQRDVVVGALCGLCLNLALSLVLVPRFGIIGAAAANAGTIAAWNVAILLMVRRRLGLWACIGP